MPLLEQSLQAYCELKDHFDRFVSQVCYTDVDATQSWLIAKDRRSLLLVMASDGHLYLLRGSFLGDFGSLHAKLEPGSDGDAMLKALSKACNAHRILLSHFRVRIPALLLSIFTGSCTFDSPVALPFDETKHLPLAHVFANCLRLQRAFETFATQLTGECVKLERLRHIYVAETACSTYVLHTVETDTPFSYILLKGSRVSPLQAETPTRSCFHTVNEEKKAPAEVQARSQLLTSVDENYVLKHNLPVYRWTVAHNIAKGFRGGQEFLREHCPPIGAQVAELRRTLAAVVKVPSNPTEVVTQPAEPRWSEVMETVDDYVVALEQAQQEIRDTYFKEVLQLRQQHEEQLQRLRREIESWHTKWHRNGSSSPKLAKGSQVEGGKAATQDGETVEPVVEVMCFGTCHAMQPSSPALRAEEVETVVAELQRLRKSQRGSQQLRAEFEKQVKEGKRKAEELLVQCKELEAEAARWKELLSEEQQKWQEERRAMEGTLKQLQQQVSAKASHLSPAEVQMQLAAVEKRHKKELTSLQETVDKRLRDAKAQHIQKQTELRRTLKEQHDAAHHAMSTKFHEDMGLKERQWQDRCAALEDLQRSAVATASQEIASFKAQLSRLQAQLVEMEAVAKAKEEEKFALSPELARLQLLHKQQLQAVTISFETESQHLQQEVGRLTLELKDARSQLSRMQADSRKGSARKKQALELEKEEAVQGRGTSADVPEAQSGAMQCNANHSRDREVLALCKHHEEELHLLKASTDGLVAQLSDEVHQLLQKCIHWQNANERLASHASQLEAFQERWVQRITQEMKKSSRNCGCDQQQLPPLTSDGSDGALGERGVPTDWEAECRHLRTLVEDLQSRLRTALNCAADIHFECEARLAAEHKALEVQQRRQERELAEKVGEFEEDKVRCQEAYGRLLVQIQAHYQGLLKEEKQSQQSETAKLFEQWRVMFDHLMVVNVQRAPWKSPQVADAEAKRLRSDDLSNKIFNSVSEGSPTSSVSPLCTDLPSPVPSICRTLFSRWSPKTSQSGAAVGSGSFLATLTNFVPTTPNLSDL
eukprot:GGOE01015250.1.p1 GENE.GGOE01015250.1~~GGOE01015250.1.p1  ORF type:complete len:1051 (-),score=259.94 GGOE01015250.1:30-3182(-)